ncbi:hypothetical protein [Kribbella sp. DT2]|uniref:hypothetical protein n=1 Tax=Kribbella sp. DT2 TaxID=3393427 RepID=UPI003CE8E1AF
MDDTLDIEQYSDESRAALRRRTDELIDGLRAHAEAVLGLRGGSAEQADLWAENEKLGRLLGGWDDAVLDHTGTSVSPGGYDDEDELEDDEEVAVDVISLVTRVDLGVRDADELLTAGRAAHRRSWAEETEADAEVAVDDVVQAVYAIIHDAGEPWLDLPGTGLLAATRVYVSPEDYEAPHEDFSPEAVLEQVAVPDGMVVFSESWG